MKKLHLKCEICRSAATRQKEIMAGARKTVPRVQEQQHARITTDSCRAP